MDMYRGEQPKRAFAGFGAPATMVIGGATILVSVALILLGSVDAAALWGGFIPARIGGVSALAQQYALAPVWLTPLTATFVHAGFLHLGFNMVMLFYTGRESERAVGVRGIVILYLVGAYAAAAAQWVASPGGQMPMIGASGALSAIVGAYSLLYGRSRARAIGPIPAWLVHVLWLALAWTGINMLIGVMSVQAGQPIAARRMSAVSLPDWRLRGRCWGGTGAEPEREGSGLVGRVHVGFEKSVQMHDDIFHLGIIDRALGSGAPRLFGAGEVGEDSDEIDFRKIGKIQRARIAYAAAEH